MSNGTTARGQNWQVKWSPAAWAAFPWLLGAPRDRWGTAQHPPYPPSIDQSTVPSNCPKYRFFTVPHIKSIPFFATSLLDDDDDSRRKQDIHRVVRVKLYTTRIMVFIVRPEFVENESSAPSASTALCHKNMTPPGAGY